MNFKDHFSGHASHYRDARPHYPRAFLAELIAFAPARTLAWDVGCGNGQASLLLAEQFERVIATDPSAPQIAEAVPHARIDYRVEAAEQSTLPSHSVDFISVAQAYHWFDHSRFAAEVRRVAKPGAVIAAYGYRQTQVIPAVDAIVAHLYIDTLGADWPPERRHVDVGLLDLPFPYQPIAFADQVLTVSWHALQFLAYLGSWSAAQRYLKRTGIDPVANIAEGLIAAWGEPEKPRTVRFDLFARVGRC